MADNFEIKSEYDSFLTVSGYFKKNKYYDYYWKFLILIGIFYILPSLQFVLFQSHDPNAICYYNKYNLEDLEICFFRKGFLLIPKQNYRYYKQEILLGGVWDNKHNGWYFKKFRRYTSFVENGAKDLINNTFLE